MSIMEEKGNDETAVAGPVLLNNPPLFAPPTSSLGKIVLPDCAGWSLAGGRPYSRVGPRPARSRRTQVRMVYHGDLGEMNSYLGEKAV